MKRSTLLFAAAAFSVGIGAGWGFGQLTGGAGPAAPAEPRSPPAAEPPSGKEADRSTGGADTSPPPVPSTAPSSAPAAAGGEGTATGSITGTVVGPDGRPLAGVLVRATPFGRARGDEEPPAAPRPPGSPPPRPDVEEAVRRFAIRLARHEAGVREATTGESGTYALDGLSWEKYLVDAWRAEFLVERVGGGGLAVLKPGSRCDFQASPIRQVLASVLLPDGKPPERAVISWAPAGGGEGGSMEWTPAGPGVEVPPGAFEFTAWAGGPGEALRPFDFVPGSDEGPDPGGHALYRSPSLTATVEDGGGERLEFRLEPRPGVLVNLSFGGANRPRTIRIAAVRLDGAPAGDPTPLLAAKEARERWIVEEAGATLPGLEPGTWLVGATFKGGRVGASATVAVAQGLTTVDLRIPDIDPMDSLRVRVLGPDGLPVPDAKLECGCRGSESSDAMGVGTLPGPDGSYRVEHYAKGAPAPGGGWHYWGDLGDGPFTWFVQAATPRYGAVAADYDPAVDREVTLRFAAPALLRVHIPGFEANPRRDRAVLKLSWEGEADRPDLDGALDAAGVARFPSLSPGPYELSLHLAEGSDADSRRRAAWAGTTVARVPLTLPSGETTVSVGLPAYSDLTVTFDGDAPGLQFIGPEGVPDRWEDGEEEGNGTVVFRDQPEGRYRLWDPRRGAMRVDLPAPGPVAFVPAPFDSLLLDVPGEGYFRDLGLQTGDLVVRIEGAELRDKDSMTKAMAAALVRGTALLTIQRGASTFEVTVDVRKFMEDEGSDLEPWVR